MVIGAIFAGGIGSRMGSADMPKQYLQLGSKPIIVHTIEKFVVNPGIDRIIVLCPKAWIAHTKDLVKKYLGEAIAEKINVVEGGSTRNGTLETRSSSSTRISPLTMTALLLPTTQSVRLSPTE